jgi:phosphonate transport system permease protein
VSARHFIALGGFLAAVAASFLYLGVSLGALASAESLTHMGRYVAGFFPPDLSATFLSRTLAGTLETLAISGIGTLLAVGLGVLLALPAAGRWGFAARAAARLLLNFLRSIPELVWAALMVIAAGLGPFAGTLALAWHTTGVLGRLFAETLENTPPEPTDALRHAGAAASLTFLYGAVPAVLPQVTSYALYRWENNIRMAAVLGFVGAGGLGQLLYVTLSLFKTHEACTVILAILAIVAMVDALSAGMRRFLGRSGA